MKDRNEIIKHLCFVHTWATVNPKYGMGLTIEECLSAEEWIDDAIKFLRAQEPVEPTEPDEDNTQYCGACGSAVGYEVLEPSGIGYVKYNYCPMCGRAVKWE